MFAGSNPANDQPVALKYLYEAKRWGARVISTNAYREPGIDPDPQREALERAYPFLLATRRGKQFNSMVQKHRAQLTGADRDHVFVNPAAARELGVGQDDPMAVVSPCARFAARVFLGPVARGTLQGFWPEVNPLLMSGRRDPGGAVPDYNARVRIEQR